MAEYVIMVNGKLNTYENYDDIPKRFDHVIKFLPDVIPEPHTEEEHKEIETYNDKLQELMKRELK
jgi:predicted alternative tryptophan synthase beta-subunit|tara:strand:- start:195 stop:389 length:195 start_codon:yes stop_codon:yes gene_type:complete